MIAKNTTYQDTRKRLWVITSLTYESPQSTKVFGVFLYQVGTNQNVQHLTAEEFERLVNAGTFKQHIIN